MTAYTGVMPFSCLVHKIWTPIPGYYPDIARNPDTENFDHLFAQLMTLSGVSTNLILLILTPLGIYFVLCRLRYLGKQRAKHDDIFEAHLGRMPLGPNQQSIEISKEQEVHSEDAESFFQTGFPPRFHKSLETL